MHLIDPRIYHMTADVHKHRRPGISPAGIRFICRTACRGHMPQNLLLLCKALIPGRRYHDLLSGVFARTEKKRQKKHTCAAKNKVTNMNNFMIHVRPPEKFRSSLC
jgi:hypothetical protein